MPVSSQDGQGGVGDRSCLAERLRSRLPEIEEAVLARSFAIADPREARDPAYGESLRAAIPTALEYGLAAIERGERSLAPPPPLLAQARLAELNQIPLEVMLRRYGAGYRILGDALMEEAEHLDRDELRRVLHNLSVAFERLVASVGAEFERCARRKIHTSEAIKAEGVRALLAGEWHEASSFDYELDGHHLAVVANGAGGEEVIRELASSSDRALLFVTADRDVGWAWLGGQRAFSPDHVAAITCALGDAGPLEVDFALGEPARGLSGWRLSHRQAVTAALVAHRGQSSVVRYGDVAILASALQDDVLASSLRELYLDPLERGAAGVTDAKNTARAYFRSGRNVSSAAAMLGVDRNTVSRRLLVIERSLGRPIQECAVDLEIALRLDELHQK